MAASLLAGCTGGTEAKNDKSDPPSSGPSDEAGDGAKVEVAETGVTNTEDSSGETVASYAIVLENSSSDVAVATRLEIRLLDGDGEPLKDLVADRDSVTTSANLILPGEKQAVTNTTYVKGEVKSIKVTPSDTTWYAGDDERFSAVKATKVATEPDGDAKATITFQAESPYEEKLSTVATYAVFRDAKGKLLGGTAPNDAQPRVYEPGSNDGQIDVGYGLPPKWDAEATEVYVDPLVSDL